MAMAASAFFWPISSARDHGKTPDWFAGVSDASQSSRPVGLRCAGRRKPCGDAKLACTLAAANGQLRILYPDADSSRAALVAGIVSLPQPRRSAPSADRAHAATLVLRRVYSLAHPKIAPRNREDRFLM